jgi:hypothetical protein
MKNANHQTPYEYPYKQAFSHPKCWKNCILECPEILSPKTRRISWNPEIINFWLFNFKECKNEVER